MAEPSPLQQRLEERFEFLRGKLAAPRPRRLAAEVPVERLREVVEHAQAALGFDTLCTITGLDEGPSLAAVYHLAGAHGTVLSLKVKVPRERPVIPSLTDLFPGGANYERELDDLLGFVVEGLPPGKRYPLPDDWPKDQKPLRKDWKAPPKPDRAAAPAPDRKPAAG